MTTPSYVASGTAGTGAGPGVSPEYPAGLAEGDLILLQVYVRNQTVAPTTPAGFGSIEDGPDTQGNSSHYWYVQDTRAEGGETGTVTVADVAGNSIIAVLHGFRNVDPPVGFIENKSTNGSGSNDDTIEAPSVTSTGPERLAVAIGGCSEDVTGIAAFSGESGGTWVLRHEVGSSVGSNARVWLQTADLASAGTVSGGSMTISSGENWCQHGFALIGPETVANTARRLLLGVGK